MIVLFLEFSAAWPFLPESCSSESVMKNPPLESFKSLSSNSENERFDICFAARKIKQNFYFFLPNFKENIIIMGKNLKEEVSEGKEVEASPIAKPLAPRKLGKKLLKLTKKGKPTFDLIK